MSSYFLKSVLNQYFIKCFDLWQFDWEENVHIFITWEPTIEKSQLRIKYKGHLPIFSICNLDSSSYWTQEFVPKQRGIRLK